MVLEWAVLTVDGRCGEPLGGVSVATVTAVAARDARDAERSTRCERGGTFFARLVTTRPLHCPGLWSFLTLSPLPFLVGLRASFAAGTSRGGKHYAGGSGSNIVRPYLSKQSCNCRSNSFRHTPFRERPISACVNHKDNRQGALLRPAVSLVRR